MALDFQVTFDCADPARMGEFWAAALGYEVQPPPPGFATWQAFLASIDIPEELWDIRNAVIDPEGVRPRILFNKVPEGKTAKNRVHLDLRVAAREVEGEEREGMLTRKVDELMTLGATLVDEVEEMGERWVVMQDPEGNEFCVA